MQLCKLIPFIAGMLAASPLTAQTSALRPVNTGASFLLINPDARSNALGVSITGLEPDANAIYEHPDKGRRQQFTSGFGVRVEGFQLDFARMLPTVPSIRQRQSPHFTLMYTPVHVQLILKQLSKPLLKRTHA